MDSSAGSEKLWYLYLLECSDGSLYAGISTDVQARYAQHCKGRGARYTRAKPPVRLIGQMPCGSKSAALRQEWAIRRLKPADKIAMILTHRSPPPAMANPDDSLA